MEAWILAAVLLTIYAFSDLHGVMPFPLIAAIVCAVVAYKKWQKRKPVVKEEDDGSVTVSVDLAEK